MHSQPLDCDHLKKQHSSIFKQQMWRLNSSIWFNQRKGRIRHVEFSEELHFHCNQGEQWGTSLVPDVFKHAMAILLSKYERFTFPQSDLFSTWKSLIESGESSGESSSNVSARFLEWWMVIRQVSSWMGSVLWIHLVAPLFFWPRPKPAYENMCCLNLFNIRFIHRY